MKERPVIFNGEMVRAILDGRKTQTRRVIANVSPDNCIPLQKPTKTKDGIYTHVMDAPGHGLCPFGQVGDRLWVRETFATLGNEDGCAIDWNENLVKGGGPEAARIYRASCEQKAGNYGLWSIPDIADWKPHTWNVQYEGSWVPSIHMPRLASRILLEITAVRVERLNDISEEDAEEEGVNMEAIYDSQDCYDCIADHNMTGRPTVTGAFKYLWASIYGVDSWNANPWVWVIEFRRVVGSDASK